MHYSCYNVVSLVTATCLFFSACVDAERVCYSAEETCSAAVTCQTIDAGAGLCVAGTIPGIDTYNKLIKTPVDYQLEIYGDPFCALALITSNATLDVCGEVSIPLLGVGFYFKVTETVSSTTTSAIVTSATQVSSTVQISETQVVTTQENLPTKLPDETVPPHADQTSDAEVTSVDPVVCLLAGLCVFGILRGTSA